MLLPTMNTHEVSKEIFADFEIVKNSIERLSNEYDRERRRAKIDKKDCYFRSYEIKSNKKNTWLIILCKTPDKVKYKGVESINIQSLVYYFTSVGLRVFQVARYRELSVFNGHLFKRYNERMGLFLKTPIEIMKHFFINNGFFLTGFITPEKDKNNVFAVCKNGLILGDFEESNKWIIYKTFISSETLGPEKEQKKNILIHLLQDDIKKELNSPAFNREQYLYKMDLIKQGEN